ncbi:MAG TPA: type VI secretion system protein TssA [Thermoanaerobaculia bacterium]
MTLPDVERFSAPISDERPVGEWLRFDPLYDEIKQLREQDDPTLPQGVWQRELKKADWPGVARVCESALESRTKDLQIAAWMSEAWTAMHGFAGFERGMNVLTSLCTNFWDGVYPALEDGNGDARVSPIVWIADRLVLPLKSVPITAPAGEETKAYAWRDWESALYIANAKPAKGAAPLADTVVTQSKFLVAVSLTPSARFAAIEAELVAAGSALDALESTLAQKLGSDRAPSLTPLRTPLHAMQQFVSRVRLERDPEGEFDGVEAVAHKEGEMLDEGAAPVAMSGAIASRAEAYHRLRQAADFLMRTEPHSPVPYLVRRAISWGNLSLAELLEELLQKNTDLATINALLGIRKTE